LPIKPQQQPEPTEELVA